MSFLAWAYALGALAVSLPILFHLIRRSPQGERPFSTLMFLEPSPLRLTRASRLDNLLLLFLRALAVLLIAAAFMRPFLRQQLDALSVQAPGRMVAVLLDTSASMRRPGVWQKARAEAERVIAQLEPRDQAALLTYDRRVQSIVPWPAEDAFHRSAARDQATGHRGQQQLLRKRLADVRPGWGPSHLGTALVHAADQMQALRDSVIEGTRFQIVVISDLQQGSDLATLQEFQWPEDLPVQTVLVQPADPTNASLRTLAISAEQDGIPGDEHEATSGEAADPQSVHVRVRNERSSSREQFFIAWEDSAQSTSPQRTSPATEAAGLKAAKAIPVYVPPGESRVVALPRDSTSLDATHIRLSGDVATYDNTYYLVPPRQEEVQLFYVGNDSVRDPEGLSFYLDLAFGDTAHRRVELASVGADELSSVAGRLAEDAPEMLVVAQALDQDQWQGVEQYVERGGTLLMVLGSDEVAQSFADWNPRVQLLPEAAGPSAGGDGLQNAVSYDYVMLGEIDFTHPLFAPFTNPRYNDFTKIHFWQFQPVQLEREPMLDVIARFDSGHPAIWEEFRGEGRIFALASGWRPSDSQLALSTKFVPLLWTVLQQALGGPPPSQSFLIDDTVALPEPNLPEPNLRDPTLAASRKEGNSGSATRGRVWKPDGSHVILARDARQFDAADQPGIYHFTQGDLSYRFAVNVDPSESQTDLLNVDELEQLGVVLGTAATASDVERQVRQEKDQELEQRQRIWQWLLVAALVVLGLETWFAGRAARQIQSRAESH